MSKARAVLGEEDPVAVADAHDHRRHNAGIDQIAAAGAPQGSFLPVALCFAAAAAAEAVFPVPVVELQTRDASKDPCLRSQLPVPEGAHCSEGEAGKRHRLLRLQLPLPQQKILLLIHREEVNQLRIVRNTGSREIPETGEFQQLQLVPGIRVDSIVLGGRSAVQSCRAGHALSVSRMDPFRLRKGMGIRRLQPV